MTALIQLRDVTRTYHDGQPVYALRSTDLTIETGQKITITGPSGAGKSTLLNILGLLDKPSAGSYQIRGVEMASADEATRGAVRGQLFGFVFQAYHLLSHRTALENVEFGMLYRAESRRTRRQRAVEAIERVGLDHRMHGYPRHLSGGERQRVAIARAVASQPQMLLCDEPTGNLDSENTARVLALLDELHAGGLTIVLVTHDPAIAASGGLRLRVCDGMVGVQ